MDLPGLVRSLSRATGLLIVIALGASIHAADTPRPLIKDLLGINAHPVQFTPAAYRPLTTRVRGFHPTDWDLGQRLESPLRLPFAANGVDWAATYGRWRDAGCATHTTLLFDNLPPDAWRDPAALGRTYGLTFAQAFGPSSSDLVASAEVGSEPGAYGNDQYRELFTAIAGGLRAGDPRLRIATCAVTAGPSTRHARSIEVFRGLERLVDIITVHPSAQVADWPTWQVSHPEDPASPFLSGLRAVLTWRDRNLPDRPVWVTEFGWDATTKRPAPDGLWARWVGVTDQQQAQWLVRATLLFATLDVQRAYVFTFDDRDEPEFKGASGVRRNGTPKPAFHALAHLVTSLGGCRFAGVVRQDGDAVVLRFRDATDERRTVLVAWSPTGDGRSVAFNLPLSADQRVERIQRMPLDAQVTDLAAPAAKDDGTSSVVLDESPLYVWLVPR